MVSFSDIVILSLPLICLFGVITNSINIAVFLHPNMKGKDPSFLYMLACSLNNLLYIGLNSGTFINYANYEISTHYSVKFYRFYICDFLARSLGIFYIFLTIFLSIQRYMVVINKRYLTSSKSHLWLILGLLLLAFIYNIPLLFLKSIWPINQYTNITDTITNANTTTSVYMKLTYTYDYNELGLSPYGETTVVILFGLRLVLGTFVTTLIDTLIVIKLRKRFIEKFAHSKIEFLNNSTSSKFKILFFVKLN